MAKKTTEKKATTKRNYTVNQDERTVSFIIGTLTDTEKAEIEEFQSYGYKVIADIKKARKEAEKMRKLENKKIPADIDYDKVPNLASEARVKLKEVRPLSFSQASRISGVNPSDIAILSVYMKRYFNDNR